MKVRLFYAVSKEVAQILRILYAQHENGRSYCDLHEERHRFLRQKLS